MKTYILFFVLFFASVSIVDAATISVGTISPNATVPAGTTVSFSVTSTDLVNAQYTLSDSFPGSTVSNSNISTTGNFTWITSIFDIGTHNITINAVDSFGFRSSITQTIVVGKTTPLSVQSLSPGSSIFSNNPLSFIVVARGYTNPSFSISDSFYDSSISSSNISASGNFGWTPKTSDVGVHNLTIRVSTPSGRTDTVYQTITVNGLGIQNLSSTNILFGTPLTFTLVPYGLSSPAYRITDSLRNNTIDTRTLNGNSFSWTPQAQDIGTHVISITATDVHGITTTSQLTVTVRGNTIVTSPVVTPVPTTTIVNKYTFTKALSVGSKGTEVLELQKKLKLDGFYSGPITGTFGALTKAAVIRFQKAKGIAQQGNVGPSTRSALNKN